MSVTKRKKRKVGKTKPARSTKYSMRGRLTVSRGRVKTRKKKPSSRSRRA